jgi:hypothetical protein
MLRGYFGRRFLVVGGLGGSRGPAGPVGADSQRTYDYEATAEEVDPDDPSLPR